MGEGSLLCQPPSLELWRSGGYGGQAACFEEGGVAVEFVGKFIEGAAFEWILFAND